MEGERIAIRAAFTFVVLLALLRLSGRRAIAQGSALDFAVALILGDMIDDAAYGQSPMSLFVVGSASVILAHIVTGLISIASPRFHHWVEGKPAVVLPKAPAKPVQKRDRGRLLELLK